MPKLSIPVVPGRILVVVTRRIGDVLLATPLIRSLKQAWPSASVDALVFQGTEGVLGGNPDVGRIISVPRGQSLIDAWRLMTGIRRRYDLALSTSPSDRPTLYAWVAGKRRLGVMAAGAKHAWKRVLLDATVRFDNFATHTVVQNLWLADALGLPRCFEMPFAWSQEDESAVSAIFPGYASVKYAVFHTFPKFTYKMWAREQWCALAAEVHRRGLRVVLTGSNEAAELRFVRALAAAMSPAPLDLTGRLDFHRLALLISRAQLYVGPDTVTTHLAAAVGTPTVALFGPSNPVKWGPWPRGCTAEVSPWSLHGTQFAGNVALVQGFGACVPCLEEGCARHEGSESACLQMLTATTVIRAIDELSGRAERLPLADA